MLYLVVWHILFVQTRTYEKQIKPYSRWEWYICCLLETITHSFIFYFNKADRCSFETQTCKTGEEVKHERWSQSSLHHPEDLTSWERGGSFTKLIFQLSLIISDHEGELDVWLTNNQSLSDICIYLPSKGDFFVVLKMAYHFERRVTFIPHYLSQ